MNEQNNPRETDLPNNERIYWKGSSLLAPVPSVMVTCGTVEKSNIITIGWCGVVSTRPARVYISVRPERHSHGIIKESGEFVINLTPAAFAESPELTPLTVAEPVHLIGYLPLYVAIHEGYFAEEGLDVTVVQPSLKLPTTAVPSPEGLWIR